jgi:hypothetical protein
MKILTNILEFITNPKNRSAVVMGLIMILVLLLLHQCNQTNKIKEQVKKEQSENIRIKNNWEASLDTLKQYKISDSTTRAEISGYELTLEELESDYLDLLGKFNIEKNKKPTTIVKTEYIIKEVIKEVPVYITSNPDGSYDMNFSDSTKFNQYNYRYLSGKIPFTIDTSGVKTIIHPGQGTFDLSLGMKLNVGLFKDDKTKKVTVKVDTDYPGITFTELTGANIFDDSENRKELRSLRKQFGVGISTGFGAMYNINTNSIGYGPYIGVGINYQPKIFQW